MEAEQGEVQRRLRGYLIRLQNENSRLQQVVAERGEEIARLKEDLERERAARGTYWRGSS